MSSASRKSRRSQRGYILLTLLLFVALLSIGFLAAVQQLEFQIKRDREEELIHRGVQYSRAVRRYFKKFGRYPTRIEELEDTNNLRFLRKRYKDPVTGKDFKPLHLTDVQMSFTSAAPGIAAAAIAAQQQGAPGALNANQIASADAGPGAANSQQTPPSPRPGGQNTDAQADQGTSNDSQGTPPPPQPLSQQVGANGAPQVFGGGAIIGVASISKDATIREFNKKNHYNQWQFIYDPTSDRGGLLMTPNQPPLQGALALNQQQNPNGQNLGPGTNPNGINSNGINFNQTPQNPDVPNQQ
jgi:type II secretory pathway pseudopilin PulG